ncbi:MAG: hypothetical protein Q9184_008374 [Pyrenodesmia sp. 2 TL-2023]
MQLRRQIRDEKEEVERREGMEERDEADDGDTGSHRGPSSGRATPRPETGEATPLHQEQDPEMESEDGTLQVGKRDPPRGRSPLRSEQFMAEVEKPRVPEIEIEDTNMKEEGEVSAGPDKLAAPFEGLVAEEEREEGEEVDDDVEYPRKPDEMDVS